ncbi:uncharacterized protein LOC124131409 isoform X3 [Haliotis rufescens]|uniref:uncharacterized protein LOC124131409 isoform X3 n=1 Tax=Haliotis rufescens TaxID=6454 RepID=UPI00201F4D25|nr:uncharacterized protein LOC124131409 isoform X3 [Haliotis rufescens]
MTSASQHNTIAQCQEQKRTFTYDLIITTNFWKALNVGSDIGPCVPILRVVWRVEGGDQNHTRSTKWKVHTSCMNCEVARQLGEAAFTRVHRFVNEAKDEYDAELLYILSDYTFVFGHKQLESEKKMVTDKRTVVQKFKILLHGGSTMLPQFTVDVLLDENGETKRQVDSEIKQETPDQEGNTSKTKDQKLHVQAEQPNGQTCGYGCTLDQRSACEGAGVEQQQEQDASLVNAAVDKCFEQSQSPSEIISKNYLKAQEVLRALNINPDGWTRLTASTALALEPAKPSPPRTDSVSTVLCLDVSESIGAQGLEQLKKIAYNFIDGIETMAERFGLEENLGVVKVGGDASVVQDLTNDYGAVRDAIDNLVLGGFSPLFEGLVVSAASIEGRGCILHPFGIHTLKPRIIFMTDGYSTEEDQREGQDSVVPDYSLRVQLLRLTKNMAEHKSVVHPVTWVPVGRADKQYMCSLAKLGKQELVEGKGISSVCSYNRLQMTIAQILTCLASYDEDNSSQYNETVTEALTADMSKEEKEFVIQAVQDKLEGRGLLPDDGPSDFDNVLERDGLPPLGSRVRRGPDWNRQDEDVEGPGTIINHANDPQLLWVEWDLNGDRVYQYRYGYDEMYEVLLIDKARQLSAAELIEIGVKVKRGVDWSYGNEDGGPGAFGIVIRARGDGKVKVRWDNGHISSYNFGCDGRFDLEIRLEDGGGPAGALASPESPATTVPDNSNDNKETKLAMVTKAKPHIIWQWKDDNSDWRLYTKMQVEKLEKEYQRQRARSCVVEKGGQSFRVLFNPPMSEKPTSRGRKRDVQRIAMSSAELEQQIGLTSTLECGRWTWM